MFRHELSGLRIESDWPLPAARRADPGLGVTAGDTLRLRLQPPASVDERREVPDDWLFVRSHSDGSPWISVGRRPDGYLIRVHEHADFLVDRAGEALVCCPAAGSTGPEALEQLLLDQIVPMVLHLRGQPSFHASSVIVAASAPRGEGEPAGEVGVVAFLGDSGMGKSTLAASLAASSGAPGPFAGLFSDDCLAVRPSDAGTILVQPSYPSLRLLPDSATALFRDRPELPLASPRTLKRRVELRAGTEALPLLRLYLLEEAEGPPALSPLRRVDAFMALTRHLHRLDPDRRDCLAREMAVLERVASEVPVARLAYRRRFEDLPAVGEAIRADLGPGA